MTALVLLAMAASASLAAPWGLVVLAGIGCGGLLVSRRLDSGVRYRGPGETPGVANNALAESARGHSGSTAPLASAAGRGSGAGSRASVPVLPVPPSEQVVATIQLRRNKLVVVRMAAK